MSFIFGYGNDTLKLGIAQGDDGNLGFFCKLRTDTARRESSGVEWSAAPAEWDQPMAEWGEPLWTMAARPVLSDQDSS